MGIGAVSDSFDSFWKPIPHTGFPCSALIQGQERCLVSLQLDMSYLVDIYGRPTLCFPEGGMDGGGN